MAYGIKITPQDPKENGTMAYAITLIIEKHVILDSKMVSGGALYALCTEIFFFKYSTAIFPYQKLECFNI